MPTRRRKGKKPTRRTARKPSRPKRTQAALRKRARPKREPAASRKRPATACAASGAAARPSGPQRLVAGVPVEVGVVVHWFPRAAAAVVELSRPLHVGDTIHVRGHSTDFVQQVTTLALDGAPVREGAPAQALGVRLEARARPGDRVYRISW